MPEKLDKKESDLSLQKSKKEIIVEIFSRRLDELIVEYDLFFRREIKTPPEKKRDELERSIRQLLYLFRQLQHPFDLLLYFNLSKLF